MTASAGFNWKKHTGEIMASTAEHGFQLAGVSTWRNNGVIVGSRYYYHIAADTTLLRGSPSISAFSPNMYIGSSGTSIRRDVASAVTSNQAGKQVALNGRFGLRPAVTVLSYTRTIATSWGSVGPVQFVSTELGCAGGDSGGPWLQTLSGSGKNVAVGQHAGKFGVQQLSGAIRCGFIPVQNIASKLSATVHTNP